MSKFTVLLSAPYMIPFLDRFQPILEEFGLDLVVPEVEERLEEDELLTFAGKIDGVICGDDRFTRDVISAYSPRLKVISKWGTGIDSIDQAACEEYEVFLGNTPGAFTEAVADSVIGYMLAFARRLPWMDGEMKKGTWDKIPGRALHECTLGVIGVGKIGSAVVQRAKPFGLELLGNDIKPIDEGFLEETGLKMVELDELLSQADFISVNCDLNPTTHRLIDRNALSRMRSDSVLINTARGPIVDEKALIEALEKEAISGAALDVFEFEPLPEEAAV